MPRHATLGTGSLTVETPAGISKPFEISVIPSQLGLFSVNGKGWGPGKIENIGADGQRVPNSVESPVKPGQMIEISGTGLNAARIASISIGGRTVTPASSRGAQEKGFDSIRVQVPPDAPRGCYVPLFARVGGLPHTNVITMSIGDGRARCEMPPGWPWPIDRGHRRGVIGISRTRVLFTNSQPVVTLDAAFAAFSENQQTFEFNRLLLLPPAGTCTAFTGLYHLDLGEFASVANALADPGNAPTFTVGSQFTISGSRGLRTVANSGGRPGVYWTTLGSEDPSVRRSLGLYLNDPQYEFSTPGSQQVPKFSGTLPGLPAIEWTNREAFTTIQRAQGATFEWRGVPSDALVLMVAASFDPLTTAGGILYCAAKPESRSMRVPPEMFAQFPATGNFAGPLRSGAVLVAVRPQTGTPPDKGVDVLRLLSVFADARRVDYK
jgi:hypothetical protein